MWRVIGTLVLGAAVGSAGLRSTRAEDPKAQTSEIKGGIEGKIKSVDVKDGTLTIVTAQGRERTFAVTKETTMVGPRGGKVRHRLKDKRFHEGMSVTVVAEGNTASAVHLGFQRGGEASAKAAKSETAKPSDGGSTVTRKPRPVAATEPEPATSKTPTTTTGKAKAAAAADDEDDDNEIPGKVKRYDTRRHILVVTLLNGKDRSFMVANDVPVLVKGAPSQRGLRDPALRAGATVEIVTTPGGRKVKEVRIVPAPVATGKKKAG
jgi:hypothetical protein